MPDCKPWVDEDFWEIKWSNNAIVEEAYKQFNGKIKNTFSFRKYHSRYYWRYRAAP